jgi:hypothetical protein
MSLSHLLADPYENRHDGARSDAQGDIHMPTHHRLPSIKGLLELDIPPLPLRSIPVGPQPGWNGMMFSPPGFPLSGDCPSPEAPPSPQGSPAGFFAEEPAKKMISLRVLQQPVQARCCGFGNLGMYCGPVGRYFLSLNSPRDLDKRNIDPVPVVELVRHDSKDPA